MSLKRMLILVAFSSTILGLEGAVSVTNVVCRQRYPWNGMVDIDYTVVCDNPDADVYVVATGEDRTTGEKVNLRTLSGDGADGTVKPGRHRLTWNAKADAPTFHSEEFVVHLTPFTGAAPYLVVDLSNGANGGNLPFRYSTRPPDISDDACRTTEMWFRLIPPGTFMMGSKPDEPGYEASRELLHEVTLTDPFYIAIFECTFRQWELITGTNVTHTGDGRPVGFTVYNDLRGANLGALWPRSANVDEDSFLGVFRARTRLRADLPTSAQWEYACRAGTTTCLNNGHDLTDPTNCPYASEVARYVGSVYDGKGGVMGGATTVGLYSPNSWGIYDMHGNVSEWCRDCPWRSTTAATNPVGSVMSSSRDHRTYRGGGSWTRAEHIRSARWDSVPPDGRRSGGTHSGGFRLVLALPGSDFQ